MAWRGGEGPPQTCLRVGTSEPLVALLPRTRRRNHFGIARTGGHGDYGNPSAAVGWGGRGLYQGRGSAVSPVGPVDAALPGFPAALLPSPKRANHRDFLHRFDFDLRVPGGVLLRHPPDSHRLIAGHRIRSAKRSPEKIDRLGARVLRAESHGRTHVALHERP